MTMGELARILGEDDAAPPRTIIGAVIRTGAFLDAENAAAAQTLSRIPEPAEAVASDVAL